MKHEWIDSAIVYQVNLRGVAAREPRNPIEAAQELKLRVSPLAYLCRSLEVIRGLGANVLYLMPLYPIGFDQRKGIGSPYAIRDFAAVDPEFGSLAEFRRLLRRAHQLGFKVILDITPNHTSRDHVWTRSHPEYYVKSDSGALFHDLDWTDTAKLDYRNPGLRKAMVGIYDYWLGCLSRRRGGGGEGVDGFRLDMAHFINDLSFWEEALPLLKQRYGDRELLFLAECYGTSNNLGLFTRGVNAAYDDDFYKVCQYGYAVDASGASHVRLSREAMHNGDFADKRLAFEQQGIAGAMEVALMNYERAFQDSVRGPWLARYTDNHDEGRGLYRFGAGAVRAVNTLAFLAPRTLPFILAGQEFGALNRPPIHDRLKPCDKGRRVLEAGQERFEQGVELEGNVFARDRQGRQAWYQFYRERVALRCQARELTQGRFALLDAGEECAPPARTVIAFERALSGSRLRCAVNLGPEPRRLGHADLFKGNVLLGKLGKGGLLEPYGAIAVRTRTRSS